MLIDTAGVRRSSPAAHVMLAKTMIELIGIGAAPRRSLCMRALRAAGMPAGTWHTIVRRIEAHGDPTPKVSPLPAR